MRLTTDEGEMNGIGWLIFIAGCLVLLYLVASFFMYHLPTYNIWSREQSGRAELAEAEFSKQVAIETAKAKKESAVFEAQAEVERAKGVKEANEIIKESLGGSEGYLRYLYIQSLQQLDENGGQIIYVPTEAGLPILESQRLAK